MSNSMVCGPAALFASVIAWRREPAPLSLVFVTVKVAAEREAEAAVDTARHTRTIQPRRMMTPVRLTGARRGVYAEQAAGIFGMASFLGLGRGVEGEGQRDPVGPVTALVAELRSD